VVGVDAVIVDAVRTAMGRGRPDSAMKDISASWLLAELFGALITRNGLGGRRVNRILLAAPLEPDGAAAIGATAWRAAMGSARPAPPWEITDAPSVETFDVPGCPTDTGQDLIHRAVRLVDTGVCDLVLVAGVTSSHAVTDGGSPWRPAPSDGAELLAAQWGLQRGELDEYAARSRRHAAEVAATGEFRPEIVPVRHPAADRTAVIAEDELDAGRPGTAHHSCRAAVGAAAVLIAGARFAAAHGIPGRGRFVAFSDAGGEPTAGPILATKAVLAESGLEINDIDHYEVSETCVPVTLAWQRQFMAGMDRFNPRGGAIALGRLAGGAGIRSMITMLRALEDTGGTFGLQVMDDADGQANATVVERWPGQFHSIRQRSLP
jgi:acetyl-CoA acyltransferase